MEVNLENPIFIIYVNVNGLSRLRREEKVALMAENFSKIPNITTWVFPNEHGGDDRVELIWQGSKYSTNPGIVGKGDDFIKTLGEIVDVVSNTQSSELIRGKIRELLIDKLLDER